MSCSTLALSSSVAILATHFTNRWRTTLFTYIYSVRLQHRLIPVACQCVPHCAWPPSVASTKSSIICDTQHLRHWGYAEVTISSSTFPHFASETSIWKRQSTTCHNQLTSLSAIKYTKASPLGSLCHLALPVGFSALLLPPQATQMWVSL